MNNEICAYSQKGLQKTPDTSKQEIKNVETENLYNNTPMSKSCQTNLQPTTKKEEILNMFYNKKIKQESIATEIGCSQQYVSKIIKQDSRYKEFKKQQRLENAEYRKQYQKDYQSEYSKTRIRKSKKELEEYNALQAQLAQDGQELSYKKEMNDITFAKCNSSIYETTRSGNIKLKDDMKGKVTYNVPKRIKVEKTIILERAHYGTKVDYASIDKFYNRKEEKSLAR
jgi:transcriptional regulator with XRE-family HTH domain